MWSTAPVGSHWLSGTLASVSQRDQLRESLMHIARGMNGEPVVNQLTFSVYLDPASQKTETEVFTGNGRETIHIGQRAHFAEGKLGGVAHDFVVVSVYPGREYDCVVYERASSPR